MKAVFGEMFVAVEAARRVRASRRMRLAEDSGLVVVVVVEGLAGLRVMPSRSLWNLRLVVARAGVSFVVADVAVDVVDEGSGIGVWAERVGVCGGTGAVDVVMEPFIWVL